MTSAEDLLRNAKSALQEGNRKDAAELMSQAADIYAREGDFETATTLFERAAQFYCDTSQTGKCYKAFENATLMLVRQPSSPETHAEIVKINRQAASIAEEASEYQRASSFYFRAADFASSDEEKRQILTKAADALENVADNKEEEGALEDAVGILKKVGRLYFTAGDSELGSRINERAVRIAMRWAKEAKSSDDLLSAGNALAEAAQIAQVLGDAPEATRLMMEAGELYESVGFFEKAGNIYDAAQEAYALERLTTARRQAMAKAGEAYLKMEGAPEAIAPLLVKGGNMFLEIGRDMKAKWAFKRASELFEELAAKAADDDINSHMSYLRYQAMSLLKWGRQEEAEAIYQQVIDHYLSEAESHRGSDSKEEQAIALEAAAEVLDEAGKEQDAIAQHQNALNLYVELAEDFASSEKDDESSKFYSKAADCAKNLNDEGRSAEYHGTASEKAEAAARFYGELGIKELETIWRRTAGLEALRTNDSERTDHAISLLKESAKGFKEINEMADAFDDLYAVFEAIFLNHPDNRSDISSILDEMDEISRTTEEPKMNALMAVIHPIENGNPTAALLALQEREEELLALGTRLRALIAHSKVVRPPEEIEGKDRTHWAYK
jgi:tetratricopeptide (TPR) repeat protein